MLKLTSILKLTFFFRFIYRRQQEIIDQLYGPNSHQENKKVEKNQEHLPQKGKMEKMETNYMPIVLSSFHPSLKL